MVHDWSDASQVEWLDGAGIDLERLRSSIVERALSPADTVARMSEEELLTFLFLPGFSLRDTVNDVFAVQGTRAAARGASSMRSPAGVVQ